MIIDTITLSSLRSNGHFQFFTELFKLLKKFESLKTKVLQQVNMLLALYVIEDNVLKKVRKSALTEKIDIANRERNRVFRGMIEAHKSALHHFNPDVVEAARNLQAVLNTYGNVSRLPIDEETAAITNMVADLEAKHASDAEKLRLDEWAVELLQRNRVLDELVSSRYQESAGQSDVAMKDIRAKVDESYRVLILCIEALYVMAPDEENKLLIEEFARMLNSVIQHYNTNIARRGAQADKENGSDDIPPAELPAIPPVTETEEYDEEDTVEE